jgi:ATP-dependent helicase HrpB
VTSTPLPAVVLPIEAALPALREALASHSRCLLVAQPGAGKTTRVPLDLLQADPAGRSRWLLLEPRRVAARLAAGYMAEQLGETLGQTVGYRVRGESKVSASTRVEVVTQGILTRMLQDDPSLEGITGIIFDEFHERSLEADLGLALALDVQQGLREDLQLLIMSATLDVGALLQVLGPQTPVIECPGRVWPVSTVHRSPPLREAPERHQAAIVREALSAHAGDVLVFLPGQGEIRRLQRELEGSIPGHVELYPLHGQLTLAQQQAVLRPARDDGLRRVILSTAIAESSLTVPGVRIVVDAGLERVPVYQARSGLTVLDTRRVNRASADQRRGRAGREAAGVCYRLWADEQMLAAHREPEMLQADLSSLVFELLRWGVQNPATLVWVTAPPAPALESARQLLSALGLLDADGSLSALGRQCGHWPTHPRLAVLLNAASALHAEALACWLIAWLEERIGSPELDLDVIFSALTRGERGVTDERWKRAARQWAARAGCSLQVASVEALVQLLARAYPDRIAQNQRQTSDQGRVRFKLVSGGQALVAETHALAKADYLVAVELDGDVSGARIFHAVAIRAGLLESCFPQTRRWQQEVRWDADAGRLVGEELRVLGALVLERRPLRSLPPEAVRQGLLDAIRQRGTLSWSDEDRQLLGRLRLLHRVLGTPWPSLADAQLLETLEEWLGPHLQGITRLEQADRLPLGRFLHDALDWSLQQQLTQLAPTHIAVPSGNRLAVDYSGEEPVLAVKLQEMFGQQHTPTVVNGRVKLVLHLLSPARRPVQVTRDLANFWATGYFEVRKDLRGRYPRHPWPEDPLVAEATARVKKRPDKG